MDVRFSRFSTGQKYAAILTSVAALTLLPVAFKRQLPNWLEGIMLIGGTAIGLSSWRLATDYGNELEIGNELKQFEKVVRIKQLEVEATARIKEYKNLLMPTLPVYDPNIHQMIADPTNQTAAQASPIALEFLQFAESNLSAIRDENGYYAVTQLQQKWGKNKQMNAAKFRDFLSGLAESGLGEFDSSRKLWRFSSSELDQ